MAPWDLNPLAEMMVLPDPVEKDVLVFTGHEPDYRWRELAGPPWTSPASWTLSQ